MIFIFLSHCDGIIKNNLIEGDAISVTVKDVLQLPSLKRAEVIAGDSAINKVVASVSVLEYSQITTTQAENYKKLSKIYDF